MAGWMGLHSELGGTFEAWTYNPESDGSQDLSRDKQLPPGIHKVLSGSEDPLIHYYILKQDLIANNRYITLSRQTGVIAYDPTKKIWERVTLAENSALKVVGVLLINDTSNYLPEEPKYTYLFAMDPYTYILIVSEDRYGDKRSIKPSVGSSASAVAGGASAGAGGGGGSSAASPPSAKRARPNPNDNITPKLPINIPSNAEGGMRKPRYSKNKKSRKSQSKTSKTSKSRKSRKTSKSRKSRN